jgi:AcrR family transcriptional regulator
MARPSSRQLILDAAEEIVSESGASRLTLEAAAERAGLSKGGLLYHFPTKEALLSAMIERFVKGFSERKEKALECLCPGPSRRLRAHIDECFQNDERREKICSSLMAASASDPRLLDPVRDHVKAQVAGMFAEFGEFAPAAAVYLAVEGMKLMDLLQLNPFTAEQREDIRAQLAKAAENLR